MQLHVQLFLGNQQVRPEDLEIASQAVNKIINRVYGLANAQTSTDPSEDPLD